MTITATPGGPNVWPRALDGYSGALSTNTGATLNATDHFSGFVFRAPTTGAIDAIGYLTGTVQGAAGSVDIDVRVVSVSTDGLLDDTLHAANTNGTQNILATQDVTWFMTTLTANATVTAGQIVGVKLKVTAFNTPTSITFTNRILDDKGATCYCVSSTGVQTKTAGASPLLGVRYSGSTDFVPIANMWPVSAVGSATFHTSTTITRAGLYWQDTAPGRLAGGWIYMDSQAVAGGVFKLVLRSTADDSVLAETPTIDDDHMLTTAHDLHWLRFTAPYDYSAATNYRLLLEPSTTNAVEIQFMDVNSAGVLGGMPMGVNCHYTTLTNSTYAQTNTRWPAMGLLITGRDNGAGAAGGGPRFGAAASGPSFKGDMV